VVKADVAGGGQPAAAGWGRGPSDAWLRFPEVWAGSRLPGLMVFGILIHCPDIIARLPAIILLTVRMAVIMA